MEGEVKVKDSLLEVEDGLSDVTPHSDEDLDIGDIVPDEVVTLTMLLP